MKLIASLIVHDEMGRYLLPCVEHLLEFCHEVRILDDGSTDGTFEILHGADRIEMTGGPQSFFAHEGRARQRLLDWTLEGDPTHVLAIDADEFVADGAQLRRAIEANPNAPVLTLCMEEVWQATPAHYAVRCDGGWCPHEVPSCYRVDQRVRRDPRFRIQDRALACGREPESVRELARRGSVYTDTALLHLGWANVSERVARHHRYAVADGGKFHAGSHLASILWDDARVTLEQRPAPALAVYGELVDRANADQAAG